MSLCSYKYINGRHIYSHCTSRQMAFATYPDQCSDFLRLGLSCLLICVSRPFTHTNLIELDLLLVKVVKCPEKDKPGDRAPHGKCAEQPDEEVLRIQGRKRKIECRGNGGLELRESHHHTFHAQWSFGKGVFERGNRRKYFSNANENVDATNNPDVDVGWPRVYPSSSTHADGKPSSQGDIT